MTTATKPKAVEAPPAIKRSRNEPRIADSAAAWLLNHPNLWWKLDERPAENRSTLSMRRRELLTISLPEGRIVATTRTEDDGSVGLYAMYESE